MTPQGSRRPDPARPNPLVGRGVAPTESRRLVTGGATYVGDLLSIDDGEPCLADPAHVVFVRSPWAHAEITGIDTSEARAQPGVVAVVTADDVEVHPPGPFAPSLPPGMVQPLLAERRARYAGEPVAVVVAETPALAVDAAELVEVDYQPLDPVLDLDRARAGEGLLFEPGTEARLRPPASNSPVPDGNTALDTGWVGSEPTDPSVFDTAEIVVTQRVMNPRMSPAPIEPRAMVVAWTGPDDEHGEGHLLVWAASQRPHGFRDELCALYQLDPDQVTVIAGPDVGGGFGGKTGRSPEERILPLVARRAGRAVSWVETRSEYLAAAPQGRGELIELTLAGTDDGHLLGVRAELVKDAGAYPMTGALLPGGYTAPCATGPYTIAHAEFRAVSVATNRVPTSAYRGAGRAPYLAALEQAVDRLARAANLDPVEVRRRNLLRPDQLPHTTPMGSVYDEANYPGDLERALEVLGYERVRAEQARRRQAGDHRQLGIGVATYNYITVGGGGEEASVTLLPDGRARVITGTTSQGHGHATTWAQVAADALGMTLADIEVIEGRTDLIGSGVGAVASRSAQTAGMAVHRAAATMVDEAVTVAADLLEAATGDVIFDRGQGRFHVVGTPARAVTWTQVAAEVHTRGQELSCGDFYDTEGANSYPSGTHLAVVEVDTETGQVTLDRFVAVDDAGARINPVIVDSQLHGGIAAGIGQALGEEIRYDDQGNLRTSTFVDYAMPTADQLPSFELVAGGVPTSLNPLGLKGVGESGTVGATPAVHGAVLDALSPLGVTDLDLPCTPERVWAAIQASGRASNLAAAEGATPEVV